MPEFVVSFEYMFALATVMALIHQVSGTPYVPGGDSPAGTDCSGLASWVSNVSTGRPAFGSRFNTGNEEAALLARGFQHGVAPNAVVIGWNSQHTAVTLPDGTAVSSGEGGGVRIGGQGAYQPQFTQHMFLPTDFVVPEIEPAIEPISSGEIVDSGPPPIPPVDVGPGPAPDELLPPAGELPPGDVIEMPV